MPEMGPNGAGTGVTFRFQARGNMICLIGCCQWPLGVSVLAVDRRGRTILSLLPSNSKAAHTGFWVKILNNEEVADPAIHQHGIKSAAYGRALAQTRRPVPV